MTRQSIRAATVLLALVLGACNWHPISYHLRVCDYPIFKWLCSNPPTLKPLRPPAPLLNVRKLDCLEDSNGKLFVNVHVTNIGTADLAVDPQQIIYDTNGNPHQVAFGITVTTQTAAGRAEMETNGFQQTFPVNDDERVPVGPFETSPVDVVQLTATVSMNGGAGVVTPDLSWTGTSQHPTVDTNGNVNCDAVRQ